MQLAPLHAVGVLGCALCDALFLPGYINDRGFLRRYYGSFRFRAHMYGMTAFLLVGFAALSSSFTRHEKLARALTVVTGANLVAVSLVTYAMCLKTYGTRSLTGSGYMVYTTALFAAGVRVIADPGCERKLVQAWLLVHAYAGTRIFVLGLWSVQRAVNNVAERNIGISVLSHKRSYDWAIFCSSTLMLRVTYDSQTVVRFLLVWLAAFLVWLRLQKVRKKLLQDDSHTLKLVFNEKFVTPTD